MADNKIQLPQSGGGLVRYFEDYKSKLEFGPMTIVIIIVIVIVLELLLKRFNIFGL
ncbi:preprotein translocase subunit Sec61beta [Candidatus Woesearchaeota archaeon]|nr:preprotein translocase subunit Sec61beta [Candidatus Woesearchaeota archaeon]